MSFPFSPPLSPSFDLPLAFYMLALPSLDTTIQTSPASILFAIWVSAIVL